ncbi:hypothetical protein NQZ68_014257 [Dissostichus eleginoides]|nr:hypothetical protein NQZ68_014257 [Dissostichus eleginoides]
MCICFPCTHRNPVEVELFHKVTQVIQWLGCCLNNQQWRNQKAAGQGETVILMLTKLFDFNLNSVTESSLWRSTDYGATYQKLNEKVGAKTILSYLYVSPNNKRKPHFSVTLSTHLIQLGVAVSDWDIPEVR